MRKIIISISMLLMIILLNGCKKDNQSAEDITGAVTPTNQPVVTIPGEVTPDVNVIEDNTEDEDQLTVEDYYPMEADSEYVYEGEGNEYAAYRRFIDFIDAGNNKLQTRTNNGGTETVRVIEVKEGKIVVVYIVNEGYYRDNLMSKAVSVEDEEILLKEPLIEGTEWILKDGRKRYISKIDVQVDTGYGSYKAIEVTTESDDSSTLDYYAVGVGLVKSIFQSEGMEVSSALREVNKNITYTQTIPIFYPDADEKIYTESIELSFQTGKELIPVLEEALKKEARKDTYLPLVSSNTKINSLYLDEDNKVHVDFSKEFVNEMNAGAGYELLILQSVTNTLGNYYGASEVYITLEGKPYESGHVQMEEGETFQVNLEDVI